MEVQSQYDKMRNIGKGQKFDRELFPHLTVPDQSPSLADLVARNVATGADLPRTGKPVYTGENPLLNMDFKRRRDPLEVSNFIIDTVEAKKQAEKEAASIAKKVEEHKVQKAAAKAAKEKEEFDKKVAEAIEKTKSSKED